MPPLLCLLTPWRTEEEAGGALIIGEEALLGEGAAGSSRPAVQAVSPEEVAPLVSTMVADILMEVVLRPITLG